MDHQFAVENHTAERYLLGELSNADRDAYEEHFFSCPACAEEVRSADEFMESARKVVQEELKVGAYNNHGFQRSVWGKWLNWRSMLQPMPAMACALLVTVSGFSVYQNRVVIPRLDQLAVAQVIPQNPTAILLTQSRGETQTAPKGQAFELTFAVPASDDSSLKFSSYEAEIVNDSNVTKSLFHISEQEALSPVTVLLRADSLRPGQYLIVIRGVTSTGTESGVKGELTRLPFEIK